MQGLRVYSLLSLGNRDCFAKEKIVFSEAASCGNLVKFR